VDSLESSTLFLSIAAVIVSVVTLYLTYLRKGKLRFLAPGFVAETTYGSNEMILLPVAAENTGTGARSARLVVVLNESKMCFHVLNLDRIALPDYQGAPTISGGHRREPGSLLVEPKSSCSILAGFSVVPSERSPMRLPRDSSPTLDLWFKENAKWTFAYRLRCNAMVGTSALTEGSVRISGEQFSYEASRPNYVLPESLA
jgi:hypothetical protein